MTRTALVIVAVALGGLLAACGNNSVADPNATIVCGHTMWSGEGHPFPKPLLAPPANVTATAPARSVLPPRGQGGLPYLFKVSPRCDSGVVLRVTAPSRFLTASVARAADGSIIAVALAAAAGNEHGTLTIEAFTRDRLSGYLSEQV
jgi:hypothetical protein